ncbi:MAG TPA: hypothetical protein VFE58_03655 [Tepidisphaeraceae bacterium]|nr:hypothetical protein [Tepidisphaeraceae bacterium]
MAKTPQRLKTGGYGKCFASAGGDHSSRIFVGTKPGRANIYLPKHLNSKARATPIIGKFLIPDRAIDMHNLPNANPLHRNRAFTPNLAQQRCF